MVHNTYTSVTGRFVIRFPFREDLVAPGRKGEAGNARALFVAFFSGTFITCLEEPRNHNNFLSLHHKRQDTSFCEAGVPWNRNSDSRRMTDEGTKPYINLWTSRGLLIKNRLSHSTFTYINCRPYICRQIQDYYHYVYAGMSGA